MFINLLLKQCTSTPGYFAFIGSFEWRDQIELTLNFKAKVHKFPEGELWFAYELFYENLSTGLMDKHIIVNKFDQEAFDRVRYMDIRRVIIIEQTENFMDLMRT